MNSLAPMIALQVLLYATFVQTAGAEQVQGESGNLIELNVFMYHLPIDSNWSVAREAERVTGIKLNSIADGDMDPLAQLENIVRYEELPDFVAGSGIDGIVNRYGPQGAFIPLEELIRTHAPNLVLALTGGNSLHPAGAGFDGNLYLYPFPDRYRAVSGYFIRKDWLDKLDLEVPQNKEDFHEVLKAFRTRDPNGNGIQDEIPFFASSFYEMMKMAPMWDARMSGSAHMQSFHLNENRIVFGPAQPEFRDFMRDLADWYREGLIDPDILEGGSDRAYMLHHDIGGVTRDHFHSTSTFNDVLKSRIDGFELIPILPPASPRNVRLEESVVGAKSSYGFAISSTTKYPVEIVKYFDFWMSPEGSRLSRYGIEGLHYDIVDSELRLRETLFDAEPPVIVTRLWPKSGPYAPKSSSEEPFFLVGWSNELGPKGLAEYRSAGVLAEPYEPVGLDANETSIYHSRRVPIDAYVKRKAVEWISGSRDVDEDWDRYLANLKMLGLDEVLYALNSAHWRMTFDR